MQLGNSYVTIMISSMTYIDIGLWDGLPRQEAHSIKELIDLLHDILRLQEVRDYCGTCYYSSGNGTYCGMGRPMVSSDCTGYMRRTEL